MVVSVDKNHTIMPGFIISGGDILRSGVELVITSYWWWVWNETGRS